MSSRKTENRWFRVKGHDLPSTGGNGIRTEEFEVRVTVTGSYHDLVQEACNIIQRDRSFFVTSVIA